MRRPRQEYFVNFPKAPSRSFGGSQLSSHPKVKRVLATKVPLHLILKSSQAFGQSSLFLKSKKIEELIRKLGLRFGVKVYKVANAGNHLHLLVLLSSRAGYCAFIKSVSGVIARLMTGHERGTRKLGSGTARPQFWDFRPFTRILSWGREFQSLVGYLRLNSVEVSHSLHRKDAKWLLAEVDRITRKTRLLALGFS